MGAGGEGAAQLRPAAAGAVPGRGEGQGCRDPRPTGALGWPGQDQRTSLLGSWRRMYEYMLLVEEEEEDEVDEDSEIDWDAVEAVEMDMEMEMEMDPPAVEQARAPHALPAVGGFTSCRAGSGSGVGGPRCRDPAPRPLILAAQLPAPRCLEHPWGVGEGAIPWGWATTA